MHDSCSMTHRWKERAKRAENRCKHLEAQLEWKQTEIDALRMRLQDAQEALRKATTKPKAERRAVLQFPLQTDNMTPGSDPLGAA